MNQSSIFNYIFRNAGIYTFFHMNSTEFLNYEDGKFSKSKGVGVFGTDAKESGIPADAWRFYIFYNRPEKSDYQFTWKDFQEKYNAELIGNLGNLVNRTLLFVNKYYGGKIPDAPEDEALCKKILAVITSASVFLCGSKSLKKRTKLVVP